MKLFVYFQLSRISIGQIHLVEIVVMNWYNTFLVAEVAQSVEQRTENPRVGGSIPPLGTIFYSKILMRIDKQEKVKLFLLCAGIAQSVERVTRNDQVRGSIPRSSSTYALPDFSII